MKEIAFAGCVLVRLLCFVTVFIVAVSHHAELWAWWIVEPRGWTHLLVFAVLVSGGIKDIGNRLLKKEATE